MISTDPRRNAILPCGFFNTVSARLFPEHFRYTINLLNPSIPPWVTYLQRTKAWWPSICHRLLGPGTPYFLPYATNPHFSTKFLGSTSRKICWIRLFWTLIPLAFKYPCIMDIPVFGWSLQILSISGLTVTDCHLFQWTFLKQYSFVSVSSTELFYQSKKHIAMSFILNPTDFRNFTFSISKIKEGRPTPDTYDELFFLNCSCRRTWICMRVWYVYTQVLPCLFN